MPLNFIAVLLFEPITSNRITLRDPQHNDLQKLLLARFNPIYSFDTLFPNKYDFPVQVR